MPRILILNRYAEECRIIIEHANLPGVERLVATRSPAQALAQGVDFDIIFGEPSLVREVLSSMPHVTWVQSIWAGVEPLLDPSMRRDYVLTNARGVFGGLMSEYVFGYLLMHERRIFQRYQAQHAGQWDGTTTGTLRDKTIGLLGVGSIGSALARTAKFFSMQVRGYTRSSETCPDVDVYYHGPGLADFVHELDYLVCVLPSTASTRHIVDASLLERLPARAVFINSGRGAVVDEPALADALRKGRLALAVLDVYEQEPLPPEHIFWTTPNLYLTFHTSAPSLPADLTRLFIENYRRYVEGQPLLYPIDFERGY